MYSLWGIRVKEKYLKRNKDNGPSIKTRKNQNKLKKKLQYEKWREIFFKKSDEITEPSS